MFKDFGCKFQNTYFQEQLSVAASGIKTNNFITSKTLKNLFTTDVRKF